MGPAALCDHWCLVGRSSAPGDLQAALKRLGRTDLAPSVDRARGTLWHLHDPTVVLRLPRRASDPVAVLRNQVRRDIGSLSQRLPAGGRGAAHVLRAAPLVERPTSSRQPASPAGRSRSARALSLLSQCPRYLKAHGLHPQAPRAPQCRADPGESAADRPSGRSEVTKSQYVLQLMHLDFHHGSRKVLTRAGERITPLLVASSTIARGSCPRPVVHQRRHRATRAWLLQALRKVGLPRSLMNDRGSAMMSGEFTAGLIALGILHVPTLPRSPHVNGKQEAWWSQVECRLLPMFEGEASLRSSS